MSYLESLSENGEDKPLGLRGRRRHCCLCHKRTRTVSANIAARAAQPHKNGLENQPGFGIGDYKARSW